MYQVWSKSVNRKEILFSMDNNNTKDNDLKPYIPIIFLVVTITIFSFFYIGLSQKENVFIKQFTSSNLHLYISSFIIAAIIFILLRILFQKIQPTWIKTIMEHEISPKWSILMSFLLCAITIGLLIHRRFISEFTEYPARDIPYKSFHLLPGFVVSFLVIIISFLLYIVYTSSQNNKWILKILLLIAYIFTTVFIFYSLLTTTIDKDSSFDSYHGSAYLQTIFNCLYYIPFDLETTGAYGHYGIFFMVLFRLFHLQSEAVFILIALCGAVTCICSIFIIHKLIRNHFLRLTAVLSIAVPQAVVYTKNYWMTYPHKTLFPMLLIAWLTFTFHEKRKESSIIKNKAFKWLPIFISYLISLFAIVWNTETGLYCLICSAVAFITYDWQKNSWITPKQIFHYILHIAGCVLSLAGAYGIVYIYNHYCGLRKGVETGLSLHEFFFPLGIIESFIGSGEHADVIFGNHAWAYVILLFLITGFYALSHTTLFIKKSDSDDDRYIPVIASIAVLGIMHFALYFEHAAYGKLSICLLPAVISIAYLCDQIGSNIQYIKHHANITKVCKYSFSCMGFLVLTILSAEVLTLGPVTLGMQGYWDKRKNSIQHLASLYNSIVPPDTFSIGSCADIINYQLHQDSGAHYRDLPNINLGGINVSEKIVKNALEQDFFSIWMMNNGESELLAEILEANNSFKLVRDIDLGGYALRVYSQIDNLP